MSMGGISFHVYFSNRSVIRLCHVTIKCVLGPSPRTARKAFPCIDHSQLRAILPYKPTTTTAEHRQRFTYSMRHCDFVTQKMDITTFLMKRKKLLLLVDLDNTLLHSTQEKAAANIPDVHDFNLFYTKLRPGTKEFLSEIAHMYELVICTHGNKMYAKMVSSIMDPNGNLFKGRIISSDDLKQLSNKEEVFTTCMPSESIPMCCVIDDKKAVWPYTKNMICVKDYFYFDALKLAFAEDASECKKPSLFFDADNYLPELQRQLTTIYKAFFKLARKCKKDPLSEKPDLRELIPRLEATHYCHLE